MQSYWFSNKSNINIIYNYSVITITSTMSNIYILANFGKYAISDCPFILAVDILGPCNRSRLNMIARESKIYEIRACSFRMSGKPLLKSNNRSPRSIWLSNVRLLFSNNVVSTCSHPYISQKSDKRFDKTCLNIRIIADCIGGLFLQLVVTRIEEYKENGSFQIKDYHCICRAETIRNSSNHWGNKIVQMKDLLNLRKPGLLGCRHFEKKSLMVHCHLQDHF